MQKRGHGADTMTGFVKQRHLLVELWGEMFYFVL